MDLNNLVFYIGADTPALGYARSFLEAQGCTVASLPSSAVTHLILNVPTFAADGRLIGGNDLLELLDKLPQDVTVIGGNLANPILQDYSTQDLLRNESYLAENAAITAECALQVAFGHYNAVLRNTPVLIAGWGRIAKCLAKLLSGLGAAVTITARKEADTAIAGALGYHAVPLERIAPRLADYRIIFNTVPAMVLPEQQAKLCRADCLKIDLASVPGISGTDVITARGLPGKLAPETAGHLIAKTILGLTAHKEVSS